MKTLVINCGSSSIKYKLYNMAEESVLASGIVEKIGLDQSIIKHEVTGREEKIITDEILNHRIGLEKVLAILTSDEDGVIKSPDEVTAVGHRVVHGGEFFAEPAVIDSEVRKAIRQTIDLAPLHNPPNLAGIDAAQHHIPNATHVAVFDTAFHQTMPDYVYMYPLPKLLYKKYKIRRYGFHGTSHKYVTARAAAFLGQTLDKLKIISCHIGNGISLTAIKEGKSFDTSMGMTPLEGAMMGTRCGDIDPAILPYVIAKEELTLGEAKSMMNKHSGLLGITGNSGDVREVLEDRVEGDKSADLAMKMYTYKLRKMIGAYMAALDGADVIIFTAGVGENSPDVRKEVCQGLDCMGIKLNEKKNSQRSKEERMISNENSKVKVLVIPTDEELMIARETIDLVER